MSILLPAFNAQATIASSLRSIVKQTFTDWECLVINDGSSDATADIVRKYAQDDPRIRVLDSVHIGLVAALQIGIEHCQGRYIARMDADDLMHSMRLEKQFEAMSKNPALDAVSCHVRLFPRESLGKGLKDYEAWLNSLQNEDMIRRDAFIECPTAHPSLMFRADVLRHFGYREKSWAEDYDLVLRMLMDNRKIGTVPERLLCWRNGANRKSMTDPSCSVEQFTQCKAHFLSEKFLAANKEYILWGYGRTGKALARALLQLGHRPSHIVEIHPGRMGNKIMGALVVPPDALPALPKKPIVVSVARANPRGQVRQALTLMGFVETQDYFCAA